MNQTVVINPLTAMMIADMVNSWTSDTGEMKETGYAVNKLANYAQLAPQGPNASSYRGIHEGIMDRLLADAKEAEYPEFVIPEVNTALKKAGL